MLFCFLLLLFLPQICHGKNEDKIKFFNEEESCDTSKICDKWLAWDKVEHFGVSAYLFVISYKIYHDFYHNHKESSLYFSGGLTFGLGVGKEFYDKGRPKGKFSYKDLVADALGIGLGLWIAAR